MYTASLSTKFRDEETRSKHRRDMEKAFMQGDLQGMNIRDPRGVYAASFGWRGLGVR